MADHPGRCDHHRRDRDLPLGCLPVWVPCEHQLLAGRCQTKAIRYPKIVMHPLSGRKLPPLGQGSGAVLLEDVAAVEVAVLVEVVVD